MSQLTFCVSHFAAHFTTQFTTHPCGDERGLNDIGVRKLTAQQEQERVDLHEQAC